MNHIDRAAALAQGAQQAAWLFWIIMPGAVALIALWTLAWWRVRCAEQRRDAAMLWETEQHSEDV